MKRDMLLSRTNRLGTSKLCLRETIEDSLINCSTICITLNTEAFT
jgi:hypothetical protein